MPFTWRPSKDCPQDHTELRAKLKELANKKSGNKLIDDKFITDHMFPGHVGEIAKIAMALARLRTTGLSTLVSNEITSKAKQEVLNWIDKVPDRALTLSNGTWTISNRNSAVPAVNTYNYVTVDKEEYKKLDPDDKIKKSRKWLTSTSSGKPDVACVFDTDGTPVIYHLDF